MQRRQWVLAATGAMLSAFAAFQTGTALVGDDFGYLMWGLHHRTDPWAWITGPEWHTYRRPLNALVWWVSALGGIDGQGVRWVQGGLWALAGTVVVAASNTHGPPPVAWKPALGVVLILLTNQVLVDLLAWRSWLTTTGSLAFLALATLSIHRRVSPVVVLLFGLAALGFKEMGALAVGLIAVAVPGYRRVGALLLLCVLGSGLSSSQKLGLEHLPTNMRFHLDTLALFLPLVPALILARFPRVPITGLLALALLGVLPSVIAAGAVVMAVGLFLPSNSRWVLPVLACVTLPLLGAAHARQYLIEAWLVLVLALACTRGLVLSTPAIIVTLVLALPSMIDFEAHRARLRGQFATQQTFLEDFQPLLAERLYHPDPMWGWNLDALYWVQQGAQLAGEPPPGTRPAQLGPLSGVWADLLPAGEGE